LSLRLYVVADVETVDLASFDSAVIASTMKKYLRELPNPVIPEQFYTKFIDAASELNLFGIILKLLLIVCCVFMLSMARDWQECLAYKNYHSS